MSNHPQRSTTMVSSATLTLMLSVSCKDCGKVYEAESRSVHCPRCAAIDMLVPSSDRHETPVVGVPHVVRPRATETPPAVVISSPLTNTLHETRGAPEAGLARYAAESDAGTIECPRCAERIQARAKMCRFCQLDLVTPWRSAPTSPTQPPRREESPAPEPESRRGRRWWRRHQSDRVRSAPAGVTGLPFGLVCHCGAFMSEVTPGWAIAMAILFFPLGLVFLYVSKERRCPRCQPQSNGVGAGTIALGVGFVVALLFLCLALSLVRVDVPKSRDESGWRVQNK